MQLFHTIELSSPKLQWAVCWVSGIVLGLKVSTWMSLCPWVGLEQALVRTAKPPHRLWDLGLLTTVWFLWLFLVSCRDDSMCGHSYTIWCYDSLNLWDSCVLLTPVRLFRCVCVLTAPVSSWAQDSHRHGVYSPRKLWERVPRGLFPKQRKRVSTGCPRQSLLTLKLWCQSSEFWRQHSC